MKYVNVPSLYTFDAYLCMLVVGSFGTLVKLTKFIYTIGLKFISQHSCTHVNIINPLMLVVTS